MPCRTTKPIVAGETFHKGLTPIRAVDPGRFAAGRGGTDHVTFRYHREDGPLILDDDVGIQLIYLEFVAIVEV
jgi:hypothetical protein